MDKQRLDNFLYSFQISLVDDKRSSRYRPGSTLSVQISVVSSFKGKTRVKNFNSIFYKEPGALLGSRFLYNWLNYFWRDFTEKYHSGPIVLDNTRANLVMLHLSIPKYRLEIKSVAVKSVLDIHSVIYYFMKLLPLIIISIALFIALNITILLSVVLLVVFVRFFQSGSHGVEKVKDVEESEGVPTADSAVSRRYGEYYDID